LKSGWCGDKERSPKGVAIDEPEAALEIVAGDGHSQRRVRHFKV
jgi:hypothetical protein